VKSIKVRKGMQFNGFDRNDYEVTVDAIIPVETSEIGEFMDKLTKTGLKLVGKTTPESSADELFLFRLAVVINDENVIFTNGTFTWLDDIDYLTTNKVVLSDPIANSILIVLSKLLDVLNDAVWNEAREIAEVDVLNTAMLDAGYELYKDLVERMLTK